VGGGQGGVIGFWKRDPGPCPVDDAPHTTCTAPDAPIVVELLPATADNRRRAAQLKAEQIQETLPPGQFTTGTYRRPRRRRDGR
jgi:hypothetical protein